MKILLLIILGLAAMPAGATETSQWLRQIGGGGPELVHDLVATSDGRLCATGTFWATVTFGARDRAKTMTTDGTQDIFVVCLDESGELTSATQFGTHRGDEVRAIAALPNGDVVITGYFSNRFGMAPGLSLQAMDSADVFVTRLDRTGNQVWARRFGSVNADSGAAIAVARNGDILLAGNFSGTMNFPVDGRVAKLNSAGKADAMVMRLTGAGDVIWARRLGGRQYEQANAVAEAPDGRIVVGGFFAGKAGFDDTVDITSRGYNDVFVAALEADGSPVWLHNIGGIRQDTLDGLVIDDTGRVHLTGSFQGQLQAGDQTLTSNGSTDIYVVRLSPHGAVDHAYSFGSANTDQVFDLARNGNQLIYTGHFQGETDFAPGAEIELRHSARMGDSNAFTLVLDEDAGLKAVQTAGGIGVEMGFAIAAIQTRNTVVLAGVFNKAFDPGIDGIEALHNHGKSDVFLLHSALP